MTAPRIAKHLPAPRQLSAEEMAQATAEGRALRESLDRATAGMEGVTITPSKRRVGAK